MTPRSLETKHPLENVLGSINTACHGSFPLCHRTDCQDQWLVCLWVTEFKPKPWLISGFIFTPKLPLSPKYNVMKCMWPSMQNRASLFKEGKTINLSAQSEDSEGWNINLFCNLLFLFWIKGCLESTVRLEMQKFKSEQTLSTPRTWQEIFPNKKKSKEKMY